MTKIMAVVASNRENCLQEFLAAWNPPPWDETIVIEDRPQKSFKFASSQPCPLHHFSWEEIAEDGDVTDPSLFSRCDSAIKMYGFWAAQRLRADIIICLDDDCHPAGALEDLTAGHIAALSPRSRWVPSVDTSPTRGVPYFNLGTIDGAVLNMGLWRGAADYDAPQKLALHRLGYLDHSYEPRAGNRLMHPQHFWPLCAMNIAFRREIAPLMYMPKMGTGSPYRRFDDIWCGVSLQRCCRYLGLSLSVGEPHIRHLRTSDPLLNLEKEAPGIRVNDHFWQVIEATQFDHARHSTPLTCAEAVAHQLLWSSRHDANLGQYSAFADYLAAEGARMQSWCNMFRNASWQ